MRRSPSLTFPPPRPFRGVTRRSMLAVAGAVAAGAGLGTAGAVRATAPVPAQPMVLATSTPGGGFSQYGEVLADAVNRRAGAQLLVARPSRGTEENLVLLREGRVEAALIQGTSAGEILQAGERQPLRILHAMYPSPGLLAVPADSSARRLEDLLGEPVVFGVRASGLVTLARQVFDALDRDIDRDFQAVYVERAAESPRLVLDGRARGLWGAGEGWPGFVALATSPRRARFLAPAADQLPRILSRYPLLKAMEVPAGAYPGIDAPLATVGSVNLILVHADLPEARAERLLNAIEAAVPLVGEQLPQARFGTRANTLASAPTPALLHPVLRR